MPSKVHAGIVSPSILALLALLSIGALAGAAHAAELRGEIVDAESGELIPARLYIVGEDGVWRFASSDGGAAVRYDIARFEKCVERHVTLSAHPFRIDLPPGSYQLTATRGKEYHQGWGLVKIGEEPVSVRLELRRWIDMAARGWYSGDTHVHRSIEELPNVMLAEDLNVAFPLTYWVTQGFQAPTAGKDKSNASPPESADIIPVDSTHVICPRNTEYEIFSIGAKQHTLGALFILNHQSVFRQGVPPVKPVGAQARREGALLELDKHNWQWSMALMPLLNVDLFELSNNHVWRTEFGFRNFGIREAAYMNIERNEKGFTEKGWLDFGFQNYYALLNCGFHMRPTAGTASGVHPVPLGFGRVYAHPDGAFSFKSWVEALDAGRSFVTTGPMLFVTVDGKLPGTVFKSDGSAPKRVKVRIEAFSKSSIDRIELVVNGEVRNLPMSKSATKEYNAARSETSLEIDSTSWMAARCFESAPDDRERFAHVAPFHFDVEGRPLRPRRVEVEYLIERVETEIARSKDVLPEAAIDEYREALRFYKNLL